MYVLSAIALLILLIAGANYMILATARSANRSREIGVRKVMGAQRTQVISQFLCESILLALLAMPFALGIVYLALPFINTWFGLSLALRTVHNGPFLLSIVLLIAFIGLVAGSYPAFSLSAFQPADILRGRSPSGRQGMRFRSVAVTFQFGVSITLLAATFVIYAQLHMFSTKNLGFQREDIVEFSLDGEALSARATLKQAAGQVPGVVGTTLASFVPGATRAGMIESTIRREGMSEKEGPRSLIVAADEDFIQTMGMNLVEGRGFSKDRSSDANASVILNEAAARALGWRSAIDKRVFVRYKWRTVIGVVGNFNTESLHKTIGPVAILSEPNPDFDHLIVRVRPGMMKQALEKLENTWLQVAPTARFEPRFLNEEISALYRADRQFGQICTVFAGIAVLVASLGLFGLAAFTAERRTKEIGIRKVLGATASSIVVLLIRDFAKLVCIGFVAAVPIAYLAMNRWLEDFAYRVHIGLSIFLMAGAVALVIAVASVALQVLRAAHANPADSLRYE